MLLPVAGAATVVVLLVLVATVLLVRGDDTEPTSGEAPGTVGSSAAATASSTDPDRPDESDEPDPLDDPMSPESIDLRYEALAGSVTTGTERCRSARERDGQEERLVCETADATLELVTWAGPRALGARRADAVTDQPGGVLDARDAGVLMGFQAAADAKKAATYLYVDDERARQSAVYLAGTGADLDALRTAYDATAPTRPYPVGPTKRLDRFTKRWVQRGDCLRIETVNAGSTEESFCVDGRVEVFVGRFATEEQLAAYRKVVVASAIADDRDLRDWKGGALYEYTTDDGTVARYWDDPSCACYAEAFLADGTYDRLARWWDR